MSASPASTTHRVGPMLVAATLIALAGALMMLVSLATRWVADGPGSTYPGYRLATVLRDGGLRPDVGATVYWSLLGIGLAAVAVAGTAPLTTRWARVARGSVGVIVVLVLLGVGLSGAFPLDIWGRGPMLAIVGGVATIASASLPIARHERKGARA